MSGGKTLVVLILAVVFLASVFIFIIPQKLIAPASPLEGPKKTDDRNVQKLKCGIESCHGLEIICGENLPEICTEEYRMGDACRKYARCEILEGECQRAESPDFDECKNCVKKCENQFTADSSMKIWECENSCHRKINGTEVPELE